MVKHGTYLQVGITASIIEAQKVKLFLFSQTFHSTVHTTLSPTQLKTIFNESLYRKLPTHSLTLNLEQFAVFKFPILNCNLIQIGITI